MEHRPNLILERVSAAAERAERARSVEPGEVCFDPTGGADGTLETDTLHFGRYEIVGEIARGGAGVVYRAWDRHLHRHAALKVMRAGTWDNPVRVTSFLREARAAARLSDPGVARIFDAGTTIEGAAWFAMELIEGPSLAEHLAGRGPLPTSEALTLFRKIATTLARVHQAGLAHRDIKPSNVLLSPSGEPLLTDFGLVIDLDGREPVDADDPVGTPAYMAPEQAGADTSDVDWQRADVYALGALLYELLSGRQPPAFWHLQSRPPPSLGDRISRDLEAICHRAMSFDPAGRYGGVPELLDDLDRYERCLPVLAGDRSLRWRGWLLVRRHVPTLRAVAVTVSVALIVWGIVGTGWLYAQLPPGLDAGACLQALTP